MDQSEGWLRPVEVVSGLSSKKMSKVSSGVKKRKKNEKKGDMLLRGMFFFFGKWTNISVNWKVFGESTTPCLVLFCLRLSRYWDVYWIRIVYDWPCCYVAGFMWGKPKLKWSDDPIRRESLWESPEGFTPSCKLWFIGKWWSPEYQA